MGTIRVIKAKELIGGSGEDHIYPVTSIKAIYDADNTTLEENINNINKELQNTSSNVQEVNNSVIKLNSNVELLQEEVSTIPDLKVGISSVNELVMLIQSEVDNISSKADFKVIGSFNASTQVSDKGTVSQVCSNTFISEPSCELSNDITKYMQENSIAILSTPGEYVVGDSVFKVNSIGLVFYKDNTPKFVDLNIPVLPPVPESGKYILQSINGTISWLQST